MKHTDVDNVIVDRDDLILVTGAGGFIGRRLVQTLLDLGFRNLRCFVRTAHSVSVLESLKERARANARIEVVAGNLLSKEDCEAATNGVQVVFHLAAGRGEKSFPDAFLNSVVTTRNLLDSCRRNGRLRRFVNVSSFTVYTNTKKARWRMLDESAPVEMHPDELGDAYAFAKIKQDQIVEEYGKEHGLPYVIVRPGYVYGPGNIGITGRVGIDTFGVFLHLGGSNPLPLTFVDNCAHAVALAGLRKGVDGEVFNVVDDALPSSRRFLRLYKRNVRNFKSFYVPHPVSYLLCCLWELAAKWSKGQLPPAFNRHKWHSFWKKTKYSNQKLKEKLGWSPKVPTESGLELYFKACRSRGQNA